MKAMYDPLTYKPNITISGYTHKEVVDRAFDLIEQGGWESVHNTKSYVNSIGNKVYYKSLRWIA